MSAYGVAPAGFRLPDETALGPVRLRVADRDRSVEWYATVLGLRSVLRADGVALLTASEAVGAAPLVELHEQPGVRSVPRGRRFGLFHFALLVPDRASLGRFLAHLGDLGVWPGMADHAVSEALYLYDPDGLGIEVYADRPRNVWPVRGRELAMTTDPLDVGDLLRAGAVGAWTGLPAGTVMGHVHLHVGDLEPASRFYHDGLGLDRVAWSYPGALFLSAGGYHHHLGVNTWAAEARPPAPDEARLLDWTMTLPAGTAEAAARSVESAGGMVTRDAGGWMAADPWGTVVRVQAAGA